jgi:hypothetical protein
MSSNQQAIDVCKYLPKIAFALASEAVLPAIGLGVNFYNQDFLQVKQAIAFACNPFIEK